MCRWIGLLLGLFMGFSVSLADTGRTLRVAIYQNAPKLFLDDSGLAQGFFIDLLRTVAVEEGWRIEPVSCVWKQCLARLRNGEIDLLPDVAYSAERAGYLDFNREVVLSNWSRIYAGKGVAIETLLDLDRKRVAVVGASVQYSALQERCTAFGVQPRFLEVAGFPEAAALARQGRADATLLNRLFGARFRHAFELSPTHILVRPSQLFFATAKGSEPTLRDALDRHLRVLKNDPESPYYRALARWVLPLDREPLPRWLWWVLGGVGVLAVVAQLAVVLSRRMLRVRTAELAASRERFRALVDNLHDWIWEIDRESRFTYSSPAVRGLLGRAPEQLLGTSWLDLAEPDDRPRVRALFEASAAGCQPLAGIERTLIAGDGRRVTLEMSATPITGKAGGVVGFRGIERDVSAKKAAEQRIRDLASIDQLTGLPNRHLFQERTERALVRARRDKGSVGILFLDLDNFKHVNDSFGHPMGDRLLQMVAGRLVGVIREEDTMARVGGDEFVIVLEELTHPEYAATAAEKLLAALQAPFEVDSHRFHIGASIGIAIFPDDGRDVTTLVRNADAAMYKAKAQGRGNYQYYVRELTAAVLERVRTVNDLRQALDREQFVLHYQPQVTLPEGRMVGVEALLYWRNPVRGLLAPGQFVPLAEESGLSVAIEDWALRAACAQLRRWLDAGVPLELVALDLSWSQLGQPDVVAKVRRALTDNGLAPGALELELSETALMDGSRQESGHLRALDALGVRLVLDDFGVGGCSLKCLKRLPFQMLKMDRSIVGDLPQDPDAKTIASAVMDVASHLRFKVTAAGVVEQAQADLLAAIGCERVQGPLFGQAMAVEEFSRFLQLRC